MSSHDEDLLIVWLLSEGSSKPVQRWMFPANQTVQIGRQPENDIVLKHPKVSRFHSSLFHDGHRWHCACFGSNGVFVGGKPSSQVDLQSGMVLEFTRSGPKLLFEMPPADDDGSTGSMTFLIDELKLGDKQSAKDLWARCMATAVRLARQRLGAAAKVERLEEDIAESAFASLLNSGGRHRIPKLDDRESLWRLVIKMIDREAEDYETRAKRQAEAGGTEHEVARFEKFVAQEPTPEAVQQLEHHTNRWLKMLPNDLHRDIAALRLEGFAVKDVAARLKLTADVVREYEARIRNFWTKQVDGE